MTRNKHLKVEVIDEMTGMPLREWSRQTPVKDKTVSCFIQADTGRPFSINIQAKMPFPRAAFEHKVVGRYETFILEKRPQDHWDYAPWHLLATLRFDGRPQKESIVYLSTAHPHFTDTIVMDGRLVPNGEGARYWHRWVFKETGVGIDALLDDLSLATSGKEMNQEEQLASLVEGLDASCTDKKDSDKAGMLEIVFERVHVSQNAYWEEWDPSMDNTEEGTDSKAPKDISHKAVTDRDAKKKKAGNWRTCIRYTHIPGDPYAIFQFKYRSEDVLRKHNFPGYPKQDTVEIPAEPMEKAKLKEKGNKRAMGEAGGEESDNEEEAARAKRATTEINKAGKHGRLAKYEGYGSGGDSDEEEMATEKRAEMKASALAALTGVSALQKDDVNNISTGNKRATDATNDGFKHLDTGKQARLPARNAIRSDWYDGDAEDSDDDDDEVKVDNKRQKMPSIFNGELKEAGKEDEVL